MANHKSAEKRIKQNEVRRVRNHSNLSTMKTAIKKVIEAMNKNDTANVGALFIEAESTIAKTKRKGAIHKNTMARKISRLASQVNKFKTTAK
jgi:small subunit ribosomal protein S20